MELESLNRWHWLAISVVVGLALALVWRDPTTDGSILSNDSSREMSLPSFTRLIAAHDKNGLPVLTDLVVEPVIQTADGPVMRVNGYKAAMTPRTNNGTGNNFFDFFLGGGGGRNGGGQRGGNGPATRPGDQGGGPGGGQGGGGPFGFGGPPGGGPPGGGPGGGGPGGGGPGGGGPGGRGGGPGGFFGGGGGGGGGGPGIFGGFGDPEMPIGSFHVMAPVPFVLPSFRGNGRSYTDVVAYLKTRQQDDSQIQFRPSYGSASVRMTIAILASVVVIGGIWPTFVGLITGQGPWLMPMGGKNKGAASASYDDWGTDSGKAHGVDAAARAAAMGQLGAMNAQLEAGLGHGAHGGGGAAGQGGPGGATQPGIRKLTGSGESVQAPISTQPQEPKEYQGQFYPVAKPHHHQDDPKKT